MLKAERIALKKSLHTEEIDLFDGATIIPIEKLHSAQNKFESKYESKSLLPGMVLLKRYLSPEIQQELVNETQELGLKAGGFYKPTYASGAKVRLHQMCLGKHWNVVTEGYEQVRTNYDYAQVPSLPLKWKNIAIQSLMDSIAVDPQVMGSCGDRLMDPDICVVNYYKKAGRNGLHIDKDESPRAMEMGSPVVSFSIGCSARFVYSATYPGETDMLDSVLLESGDVLIFGGPSRSLVHALARVYPKTEPHWLHMRPGRLNFTFREYEPPISA